MTSNPHRKWKKKLRNAKTEEQRKKAEAMLKVFRPSSPSTPAPPKMKESDEDVFNEAQKWNKQHYQEKNEKEKRDKVEKKKVTIVGISKATLYRVNQKQNTPLSQKR